MRKRLDDEMDTTRQREHVARRVGIPVAVAAMAAALTIGGYVIASGDDGTDADPAGQGDQVRTAGDEPMADPDQAYQECVDLVMTDVMVDPPAEAPTGRLAVDDGTGIVVVVANSTEAYTCIIEPDSAVSYASPLDGTAEAKDFWFAMNVSASADVGSVPDVGGVPNRSTGDWSATSATASDDGGELSAAVRFAMNVSEDYGEFAWAGGQLPDGVTGVSYAFPDGHTEEAVVQDGFWAMQYHSDEQIAEGLDWQVEVTLDGAGGQSFTLDYTAQCNQASHGC